MKSSFASILVILTSTLLLTACGTCCREEASLTPPPVESADPDDSVMREAVTAFLAETDAPVSSMYEYRRVDLDGDKRRDALVLFKNPYGFWCDLHGCTMLVLKAGDDKFTLVNAIQPVRAPLYISEAGTNGWKSLIVRVTGRWDESKDVAMMFDGNQYPDNPAALPAYMRFASAGETAVFY